MFALRFNSCATIGVVLVLLSALPAFGNKPTPPIPNGVDICGVTVRVSETFNASTLVTPMGPNADLSTLTGNSISYVNNLVSIRSNTKVGSITSVCFLMSVVENYCTTTMQFAGAGDVTFIGPFTDSTGVSFTNSIAGGTGAFDGATGNVLVNVVEGGVKWAYTLSLKSKPRCT